MKEILETTKVNVNGNKIAVCLLQNDSFENLQESNELRAYLVNQHKDQVDTVMAVSKLNDIAVKTVIFEPNSGDLLGSFSNMCGNGLRAIYKTIQPQIFITPAGTFFATTIENKDYICTRECRDIKHLQEVVITDEYIKSLKRSVKNILNKDVLEVRLCGNFEGDSFNGEPHFVILLKDLLDQKELINLAKERGYDFCVLRLRSGRQ
jgi:diaminopimelate epimerase